MARIGKEPWNKGTKGIMVPWNKGLTKETDERIAEGAKKSSISHTGISIPKSLKWREERSKQRTQYIIDGKLDKSYKYGKFFSKKNNKKLNYRSSYELKAYEILEKMEDVIYYVVEPFSIKYFYEGIIRRTIPDILVNFQNGKKELIEVKPAYKFKIEKEKLKLQAMKQYAKDNNIKFSIWTEKELFI